MANAFDMSTFNGFQIKMNRPPNHKITSSEKLKDLREYFGENDPAPEEKPIHEQSIIDIFIGIKNTWFHILDDVLSGDITWDMFTKENRLFYIGLTIIIVAILLYIYNYFTEEYGENRVTIEKHYVETSV